MWCIPIILVFHLFFSQSSGHVLPDLQAKVNVLAPVIGHEHEEKMTIFRLPRTVRPIEYFLRVDTQLEPSFTFSGNVRIKVSIEASTRNIVLNVKSLNIDKVTVNNPRGFPIFNNFTLDEANEQISIFAPEVSVRKVYDVIIEFHGILNDNMDGYYRSSYAVKDQTKWLAITQFEATSARMAFPCFDEPGYKTPFTMELGMRPGLKALSNMDEESRTTTPDGQLVRVKFQKSEPMPTYLVAYGVTAFESYTKPNNRVRVWSREDAINDCMYIQEKGELLLKALETYLGVNYKLKKLDIVAVPDFAAGAMENYGLTTYRQKLVEIVDGVTTSKDIEYATSVIAHEFSHMWFGDLVTPAWWDFLWLNESFARYFQYIITSLVEKSWRMGDLFVIEQVHTAMQSDLKDSHPITAHVSSPREISDIFDHITYNKGGSVLRMLEHFITPAAFQAALSTYLDSTYTSGGGVTDPSNLFEAIVDTTNTLTNQDWHETMNKFKATWIDQAGYPLVTVKRDYSKKTAVVTQEQFLLETPATPSERRWLIPLTYTTSNEKNFALEEAKKKLVLFQPTDKSATIEIQSPQWLVLNVQEIGFYRVNYDDENWRELIETLHKTPNDIHVLNRAQLIDDSFNLARSGTISYATPMTLSKYLAKETDPIPWQAALTNFRFLLQRYQSHLATEFKKHLAGLIKVKYEELSVKGSSDHVEKTGLITMSQWACYLDVDSCVNKAKTEIAKLVQNPEYRIEPEIKESVLCTGLRLGGEAEWKAVWDHYVKTTVATEKVLTLNVLPCSTHAGALNFLFNELMSGLNIRSQDYMYLIRSISQNAHHIQPALVLLKDNYKQIVALPKGESIFKNAVTFLKHGITTDSQLQQIVALRDSNETMHAHVHTLNHTIDFVNKNFEWQAKNLETLRKWFKDQDGPSPPGPGPNPNPDPNPKPGPTQAPSSAARPIAAIALYSLAIAIIFQNLRKVLRI